MVPLPVIGPLASALGVGVNNNQHSKARGVAVSTKAPMNQPWASVVSGQRTNSCTNVTSTNQNVLRANNAKSPQDSFFPLFFPDVDQPKVDSHMKQSRNREPVEVASQSGTFDEKSVSETAATNISFENKDNVETKPFSPKETARTTCSKNAVSFRNESYMDLQTNSYVKHKAFNHDNQTFNNNTLVFREGDSSYLFDSLGPENTNKKLNSKSPSLPPPPPPIESNFNNYNLASTESSSNIYNTSMMSSTQNNFGTKHVENFDVYKKFKNSFTAKRNTNMLKNSIATSVFEKRWADEFSDKEESDEMSKEDFPRSKDSSVMNTKLNVENFKDTDLDDSSTNEKRKNHKNHFYVNTLSSWRHQESSKKKKTSTHGMSKEPSSVYGITNQYRSKKEVNTSSVNTTSNSSQPMNNSTKTDQPIYTGSDCDWRNREKSQDNITSSLRLPNYPYNSKSTEPKSISSPDDSSTFSYFDVSNAGPKDVFQKEASIKESSNTLYTPNVSSFEKNPREYARTKPLVIGDYSPSNVSNTSRSATAYTEYPKYKDLNNVSQFGTKDAIGKAVPSANKVLNKNSANLETQLIGYGGLNECNPDEFIGDSIQSYNENKNYTLNDNFDSERSVRNDCITTTSYLPSKSSKQNDSTNNSFNKYPAKMYTSKKPYSSDVHSSPSIPSSGVNTNSERESSRQSENISRLISDYHSNVTDKKSSVSSLAKNSLHHLNESSSSPSKKYYSHFLRNHTHCISPQQKVSTPNSVNLLPSNSSYILQSVPTQDTNNEKNNNLQMKNYHDSSCYIPHNDVLNYQKPFKDQIDVTHKCSTNQNLNNRYYYLSSSNMIINQDMNNHYSSENMHQLKYHPHHPLTSESSLMPMSIKLSNDLSKNINHDNSRNNSVMYRHQQISQHQGKSSNSVATHVSDASSRKNQQGMYASYYDNKNASSNFLNSQHSKDASSRHITENSMVTVNQHSDANLEQRNLSHFAYENQQHQLGINLNHAGIMHERAANNISNYNSLDNSQSVPSSNSGNVGSNRAPVMVMVPPHDDLSCYAQQQHRHFQPQGTSSMINKNMETDTYYYYTDSQSNSQVRQAPQHVQSVDIYNHHLSNSSQYSYLSSMPQEFITSQSHAPPARIISGYYPGYHPSVYERTLGQLAPTTTPTPQAVGVTQTGYHTSMRPLSNEHLPLAPNSSNMSNIQSSSTSVQTQPWNMNAEQMVAVTCKNHHNPANHHHGVEYYSHTDETSQSKDDMKDLVYLFDSLKMNSDNTNKKNETPSSLVYAMQSKPLGEYNDPKMNTPSNRSNVSINKSKYRSNEMNHKAVDMPLSPNKSEKHIQRKTDTVSKENKGENNSTSRTRSKDSKRKVYKVGDNILTMKETQTITNLDNSPNRRLKSFMNSDKTQEKKLQIEYSETGDITETSSRVKQGFNQSTNSTIKNRTRKSDFNKMPLLNTFSKDFVISNDKYKQKNEASVSNIKVDDSMSTSKLGLSSKKNDDIYMIPKDVCRHFLLSRCTYPNCSFSHSEDALLRFNEMNNRNTYTEKTSSSHSTRKQKSESTDIHSKKNVSDNRKMKMNADEITNIKKEKRNNSPDFMLNQIQSHINDNELSPQNFKKTSVKTESNINEKNTETEASLKAVDTVNNGETSLSRKIQKFLPKDNESVPKIRKQHTVVSESVTSNIKTDNNNESKEEDQTKHVPCNDSKKKMFKNQQSNWKNKHKSRYMYSGDNEHLNNDQEVSLKNNSSNCSLECDNNAVLMDVSKTLKMSPDINSQSNNKNFIVVQSKRKKKSKSKQNSSFDVLVDKNKSYTHSDTKQNVDEKKRYMSESNHDNDLIGQARHFRASLDKTLDKPKSRNSQDVTPPVNTDPNNSLHGEVNASTYSLRSMTNDQTNKDFLTISKSNRNGRDKDKHVVKNTSFVNQRNESTSINAIPGNDAKRYNVKKSKVKKELTIPDNSSVKVAGSENDGNQCEVMNRSHFVTMSSPENKSTCNLDNVLDDVSSEVFILKKKSKKSNRVNELSHHKQNESYKNAEISLNGDNRYPSSQKLSMKSFSDPLNRSFQDYCTRSSKNRRHQSFKNNSDQASKMANDSFHFDNNLLYQDQNNQAFHKHSNHSSGKQFRKQSFTDQPKSSSTDQPKLSSTDQPKSSSTDQPKLSSTDQPKSSSTDQPKSSSTDQPKSSSTDQPKSSSNDPPKSSSTSQQNQVTQCPKVISGIHQGQPSLNQHYNSYREKQNLLSQKCNTSSIKKNHNQLVKKYSNESGQDVAYSASKTHSDESYKKRNYDISRNLTRDKAKNNKNRSFLEQRNGIERNTHENHVKKLTVIDANPSLDNANPENNSTLPFKKNKKTDSNSHKNHPILPSDAKSDFDHHDKKNEYNATVSSGKNKKNIESI